MSHLRWDFVYQRPQHLLSRCAREHRVWFWEEPKYLNEITPRLAIRRESDSLVVVCPELPDKLDEAQRFQVQQTLLANLVAEEKLRNYVLWYYTPMARNFTRFLSPKVIVYDCMDELSAFRGAPPGLRVAEADLFEAADLVFTGGRSLYESKRSRHPSVHCFPSSIDTKHFRVARKNRAIPADQAQVPEPRIGYCGVIDERMDLDLLAGIARRRPDWHFVMVGPVVKISELDLPRAANIHYLGPKQYKELPQYMAGWRAGMLPFARNESTRFISPTKTPEYLAAGLPVVSTSITDVVRPYGVEKLVEIADSVDDFAAALERCLQPEAPHQERRRVERADKFLALSSWDRTWNEMEALIKSVADPSIREEKKSQDRLQFSSTAD
jgi:UDP-galactopyranose mutase